MVCSKRGEMMALFCLAVLNPATCDFTMLSHVSGAVVTSSLKSSIFACPRRLGSWMSVRSGWVYYRKGCIEELCG